jgi:putative transposase
MFAIEFRWKIIAMEIMPDHVHLFLNTKPTDNPAQMMNKIKCWASHHLRKEFPELLKLPTLWTPSPNSIYCWQYQHRISKTIY